VDGVHRLAECPDGTGNFGDGLAPGAKPEQQGTELCGGGPTGHDRPEGPDGKLLAERGVVGEVTEGGPDGWVWGLHWVASVPGDAAFCQRSQGVNAVAGEARIGYSSGLNG